MHIQDTIYDMLEELRITDDSQIALGIYNSVSDKLRACSLPVDFLQDMVEILLDCVLMQLNSEAQGVAGDLIEQVYLKNHSVAIDISSLVAMIDDSNLTFTANVLRLMPFAQYEDDYYSIARQYSQHSDPVVAKNALEAMRYVTPKEQR